MNPNSLKSLDKLLNRMERQSRRGRGRISTAPFVLTLGLILADVMLTRLVPMIWEALLPHGLEQVATFRGWPALIWRSAVFCTMHQRPVLIAIGVAFVVSCLISFRVRPLRMVVWLSAAAVIALNAAILLVTIQTSMRATAAVAGIDLD
jgi:hypothetical protein